VSPENLAAGLKFSWPTYKSGLRVMIYAHLQTGSTWAFAVIFSWEVGGLCVCLSMCCWFRKGLHAEGRGKGDPTCTPADMQHLRLTEHPPNLPLGMGGQPGTAPCCVFVPWGWADDPCQGVGGDAITCTPAERQHLGVRLTSAWVAGG
jgi:hypothetical protein